MVTETPDQSVQTLQTNLSIGTHQGVRNLAPKHVGRKETLCSYQNFSREIRLRVYFREP
jgi:hypothetical protein